MWFLNVRNQTSSKCSTSTAFGFGVKLLVITDCNSKIEIQYEKSCVTNSMYLYHAFLRSPTDILEKNWSISSCV